MIFAPKLLHSHIFPILSLCCFSFLVVHEAFKVCSHQWVSYCANKKNIAVCNLFFHLFVYYLLRMYSAPWVSNASERSFVVSLKLLAFGCTAVSVVPDGLLLKNAVVIEEIIHIHGGGKVMAIMFMSLHIWQCPDISSIDY